MTERAILRQAYIALLLCGTACSRDAKSADPADPAAHDAGMAAPVARTALLEKLGPYHRAIRTNSAQAQQFFDEGLTLLYGFNHEEAMASFARAAALDTLSPMPHWGMALALGTNTQHFGGS